MVVINNNNNNNNNETSSEAHPSSTGKRKRRRRGKKDDYHLVDNAHSIKATVASKTVTVDSANNDTSNSHSNIHNNNHNQPNHTSKKRRRGNPTKSSTTAPSLPTTESWLHRPHQKGNQPPPPPPQQQQQQLSRPRHTKTPLSPAVLEFSFKLKDLVRQKNLSALLECYYHPTHDTIRDEHHACIVIDACAKGGGNSGSGSTENNSIHNSSNIEIAEQILANLQPSTAHEITSPAKPLSSFHVETLTALLKVYVHSGKLHQGWELFRNHIIRPNVRTLNTLLRGCLWSAVTITTTTEIPTATVWSVPPVKSYDTASSTLPPASLSHSSSQTNPRLCGGVVTSEHAWQYYMSKCTHPTHRQQQQQKQPSVDTSSYEYSIQLLCQSLQVDIATKRIEEYCTIHNIGFKGTAKIISNRNTSNNNNKNSLTTTATTTSLATIYETLAVVYLALSRAYALLMVLFVPTMEYDTSRAYGALLWTACQRCLSAIKLSRAMLLQQHSMDTSSTSRHGDQKETAVTTFNHNPKKETATTAGSGGKRGWKTGQQQQQQSSTQREFSNVAYRTHRLSELEMEVLSLLKHCKHNKVQVNDNSNDGSTCNQLEASTSVSLSDERIRRVIEQLQNKLLYFSGGATTSTTTAGNSKHDDNGNVKKRKSLKRQQKQIAATALGASDASTARQQLLVASWYSFGLSQVFAIMMKKKDAVLNHDTTADGDASTSTIDDDYNSYSKMQQSTTTKNGNSVIDEDGMINVDAIFSKKNRPLDIEIGAGFGTWIVEEAQRNPNRNYIAMELRADRCYQIYTRAMLQHTEPLSNVCVIGCDCNVLLRARIKHKTVSTFYAHHPEPPTQVLGDNNKFLQQLSLANNPGLIEPIHMLHSTTILYMCQCLKKDGFIVIVSDNRSYIRLVAATFTKVIRQHVNVLRTMPLHQIKKGMIASFNDDAILQSLRSFETFQSVVDIHAYDSNTITTNTNKDGNGGTSYFDRLWRTGAGTHSEMHTRFVIVMQRGSGVV